MVFFCMVDNDVVQRLQIDLRRQILYKLAAEFVIHRIDQYRFFLTDQIAVIAAALQGLIFRTVKITHFPITLSDPLDVVFYLDCHARYLLINHYLEIMVLSKGRASYYLIVFSEFLNY
ncbi:hypothetical protein D3C80_1847870 [compost metagenome]